MYKFILLVKLIAAGNHTDVLLANGEKLTLRQTNPKYDYCLDMLTLSLETKEHIGAIISPEGELLNVVTSESGVVSSFHTHQSDKLGISMLPLAGIYSVAKNNPHFERFRSILAESHRDKKRVVIFLNPKNPSDIIDVRLSN